MRRSGTKKHENAYQVPLDSGLAYIRMVPEQTLNRCSRDESVNLQVFCDIRELPGLNEKVGIVDKGDGAECAGVVLGPHPAAVEHAAVKEELKRRKWLLAKLKLQTQMIQD